MPYTETEMKLKDLIRGDINSTEGKRNELKNRSESLMQMWKGERTRKAYTGRANISVPFPYWSAETMLPRLMSSVFGGRDVIEVYPRPGGTDDGAHANKVLLNYQLMFEMNFYPKFLQFCASITRKGLGIAKIIWDKAGQHPVWINIKAEDFAVDPKADILQDARWVAHKVEKTKEELDAGVLDGRYNAEAIDAITRGPTNTVAGTTNQPIPLPKERQTYELWEWWGDFNLEGKGPVPIIALWGNNELLRILKSPYGTLRPFVMMNDVTSDDSPFGHSENQATEGLFNGMSDLLNQRLDNNSMAINRLWTVIKGSGIRRDKLISVPWGVVEVQSHDDIRSVPATPVTDQAYREVSELLSMAKDTNGLTDHLRGVDRPSVDTVGGLQLLVAQANMRPGLKVQTLQFEVIKRAAEIMIMENQMFLERNKAALIIGEREGAARVLNVSPKLIKGQYDVMPMGAAIAGSRDVRIGQITNMLNVLRGFEAQGLDILPIVKELVYLAEIKNPDQVTAGWEQQRAMRMQALQQGQAGGLPADPTIAPMQGIASQAGVPNAGVMPPDAGMQ